MNTWRNRLAWHITNFVLNHIASKDYADAIEEVVHLGLAVKAKKSL